MMTDRQGVEIDYCPKCRGVWLDRGELDKLIERSQQSGSGMAAGVPHGHVPPPVPMQHTQQQQGYRRDYDDDDDDDRHKYKKKRRGGFLGEIFDFD
jgi:hypothetical protein